MTTHNIHWEYLIEYDNFHSNNMEEMYYLDRRGREGWELITVIKAEDRTYCRFYFKRPKITTPTKQEP